MSEAETVAQPDGLPSMASPALAENTARLDLSERIERLLQGQQDVLEVIRRDGDLSVVLAKLAQIIESLFAPARCNITLRSVKDGRVRCEAAPNLPPVVANHESNPTAGAVDSELVVVRDLSAQGGGEADDLAVMEHGFQACWIQPIADCGTNTAAAIEIYRPDGREPDEADRRVLRSAIPLVRLVVTSAQQAAALRAADERLSSLASTIPGVIYQRVVQPDGKIQYSYISDGARELFGVSAEEIMADPDALFRRHSPEYKTKFRERLLEASRSLTTWNVEASIITPDGQKKYTHAIARPTRQADGSVLWTGVILDETRTREALIETLAQGFVLFDASDRLVIRNSCYGALFPLSAEVAVPGASYSDLIRAEIAARKNLAFHMVEQTEEFQQRIARHADPHNQFELRLDDGTWLIIDERRTSDGGTVLLYTDVTKLKVRDRQIEYLVGFESLAKSIPGVIYQRLVSPEGDIHYCYISDGVKDLFGVTPEEVLADPDALLGRHSPEYKAKFRERLMEASKSLITWDVQASVIARDGSKKYTHAIARPERQPDGSVLWTGVILDETRTRKAFIETLAQGLLLFDPDDKLVLCNSYYLKLFPTLEDLAVTGVRYYDLVAAELLASGHEHDAARAEFRRHMELHRRPNHMHERILQDGRCLLVNEHRSADGGTIVLYTDVTELKHNGTDSGSSA